MRFFRYFFLFIFFLLIGLDGYGQAKLENKVIATLLNDGNRLIPEYKISRRKGRVKTFHRHKVPEFVLLNVTKSPLNETAFDTASMFERKVLLNKDREMLHDFCDKNRTSLRIDSVADLESKITYINNSGRRKIFGKEGDWHSYYVNYGQKPFVNISRPGLNKKKNKAFIYLTYSLGKNDGAGYYLVMKKSWGKWKMKGPMLIWIL